MFKKIAVTAALAILASPSFAAPPSFYAGADVGSTKLDDISDRQTSYGGFLGYQFNDNIAVEAGYRRLADFDVSYGTTKVGVTLNQAALSVLGIMPLSSGFNVFGRLGYNRIEAKASVSGYSAADTTSGVLYGIGVGYSFNPNLSTRIEWQKPSSDSSNVSAAVIFRF